MKHRGLTLLLALVFLLSVFMFCTTAFAAEKSADGLEAVLSTDKKDYVNGENIGVTLDVTNTSIYVDNIRTELIIPEGVDLVEGQLKSDAAAIAVGQKVTYSYVLSVPKVEVPTTQAPTTQPGTGDDGPADTGDLQVAIFGALAIASLAGLIALTFGAKLLKQRWFVLILCAGLLLGMVAPVAASAAVTEKSFELTEAITIDGEAKEVKAIITYDLDDGEILASEVEFKKDGKSLYDLVPEKGWFTASNKAIKVDGVAASNTTRPEVTASYIDMLFGCTSTKDGKFVKGEFDNEKIISDDAEKELLVGLTKDVASRKALAHINYNEWIIAEIDGKVVVTGWFDNATAAAARYLYNLVKDQDNVTLALPITGKVEGFVTDIPQPSVGTFDGGMDGSEGTMVLSYSDMNEEKFLTYAKQLEAAGFTLYAEHKILNYGERYNLFRTYTKGESAVHISFLPDDFVHADATKLTPNEQSYLSRSFRSSGCEMRIVTDSTKHLFTNDAANKYEDAGITPKVSLVNLYNQVADGNNNAECMIYTLADGSFIVVDGGFTQDADHVYKALKELNERKDGKIVVAAWIMSHHHGDHIGAFNAIADKEYAKEINIEQFIYNPTASTYAWRLMNAPYNYAGDFNFTNYCDAFITAKLAKFGDGKAQIVNPHMGQVMKIRNAEVEFLYTGDEDMFPLHMDNTNDSSLVFTVNFDMGTETTEDDSRILQMNDACCDTAYAVLHPLFSRVMDCDIVQVGHHGLGGPSTATYRMMAPTVAIWCSTESTAIKNNWFVPKTNKDGSLAGGTVGGSAGFLVYRALDDTNPPADLVLMAEHYVQTLNLPFAKDDVIDKRILTDYYTGLYATEEVDVAFLPAFHFRNEFNKKYDAIVDALASYDADVLILTQADHESALYPNGDIVNRLLEDLDFTYAYYAPVWGADYGSDPTVSADGTAGHMILSRYPINEAKTLVLAEGGPYKDADGKTTGNPEGRGTCYVQLDVDGLTLDVYATHFAGNANWTKFKEQFDETQTGDYWMILGNTQIGGNAATAATKLGLESVSALGTGDTYNVFGSDIMTFSNYEKDTKIDEIVGGAPLPNVYTFTANLSHYMVSDDVRKPTPETDFMAWTVNNYAGTQSIYEIISNELKYVHPEFAVLIMVDDIRGITVTPEELAEFAGYKYCEFVEAWTYKDAENPLNARHRGSIIFSDTELKREDDVILVADGTSAEGRRYGHVIATINDVATDIWFGFHDTNRNTNDGDDDTTDEEKQITRLTNAVKAVADSTKRPFIIYGQSGDFAVTNTSFAGKDVIDVTENVESYICALSGTNAATDPLTLSDYYIYKSSILGINHPNIGDQYWMTFGEPFVKQQLTVENGSGSGTYKPGKEVTVTANEGVKGYAFDHWTAEGLTLTEEQKTSAKITITMPKNAVTLTAVYKDVPSEIKTPTGETVSLKVGSMMTYRFIHGSNKTAFAQYTDEVNEILKSYGLDVFALELVDQNASGYNNKDVPALIYEGIKDVYPHYYYAPYWDNNYSSLGNGSVGHVVYSKYPISFAETITYSYTQTSEDRGLAHVVIEVAENTYVDIYVCAVGTASTELPLIADVINTKSKGDYWMLVGSHKTTASGFAAYVDQTGITASENRDGNRTMLASAGLTLSDSGYDWDSEKMGKINQVTGAGNPAEMHWATVTVPTMGEPEVTYGVKVDGEYVGFYKPGETVTLNAPAAQAGFKFSGWNLPEGLTLTEGTAADETIKFTMPAEILYFTVNYEKIQTATVSFNANGGYGTMADVVANAGSYTLPENGFLRPGGKVFAGWAESATGTPISTDSITLLENKTLYAIWEDTENIEYLSWWASVVPASGAELIKKEIWRRDADIVALVSIYSTTASDLDAYAKSFNYPHYYYEYVTTDSNGDRGNIILSKFKLEKKGKDGLCYWYDADINGVHVDVYAGYDCNGKQGYIKRNAEATGNDFVLLGHTFGADPYTKNYDYGKEIAFCNGASKGWANIGVVVSLDAWEVVGTPAPSDIATSVGGNAKKYVCPLTVRLKKFTVSFDANGGIGAMDTASVTYGDSYTLPKCGFTAPEGKMFVGWATKADGEVITDETIKVTGDVTLYAVWKDYTELKVGYFSAYRFSGKYKTAATATEINNKILNLDLDVLVINQIERGSFVYPGHWNTGNGVVDPLTEAVKSKYPYYYFASAGKIVDDTEGEYGNLILSKYPIEDYETISLADGKPFVHNTENNSYSGFVEGRPAGRVKLNVNGYTVDVFYTHAGDANQCATLAGKIAESTADAWIAVGFLPSMDQKLTDYKQVNYGNCRIMTDSALVLGTLNTDKTTFYTYNTSSILYSATICVPKG